MSQSYWLKTNFYFSAIEDFMLHTQPVKDRYNIYIVIPKPECIPYNRDAVHGSLLPPSGIIQLQQANWLTSEQPLNLLNS